MPPSRRRSRRRSRRSPGKRSKISRHRRSRRASPRVKSHRRFRATTGETKTVKKGPERLTENTPIFKKDEHYFTLSDPQDHTPKYITTNNIPLTDFDTLKAMILSIVNETNEYYDASHIKSQRKSYLSTLSSFLGLDTLLGLMPKEYDTERINLLPWRAVTFNLPEKKTEARDILEHELGLGNGVRYGDAVYLFHEDDVAPRTSEQFKGTITLHNTWGATRVTNTELIAYDPKNRYVYFRPDPEDHIRETYGEEQYLKRYNPALKTVFRFKLINLHRTPWFNENDDNNKLWELLFKETNSTLRSSFPDNDQLPTVSNTSRLEMWLKKRKHEKTVYRNGCIQCKK